jgi:hypothetical protein
MDLRRATLTLTALAIFATPAISQTKLPEKEDPWLLLDKITHKRTYSIETRDGQCIRARIKAVTPDRLTTRDSQQGSWSPDPVVRRFSRDDVVHVRVAWNFAGNIYYSSRSSWADVAGLRVGSRERLNIVTKSGKTYDVWRPYTISDDGIITTVSGKQLSVPKKEIVRVYAILEKPVTDMQEYNLEELGPMIIFDPYFYEYKFHLEQYIPVLLYEASRPEDNSPGACEGELQQLQKKRAPQSAPEIPVTPGVSPLP